MQESVLPGAHIPDLARPMHLAAQQIACCWLSAGQVRSRGSAQQVQYVEFHCRSCPPLTASGCPACTRPQAVPRSRVCRSRPSPSTTNASAQPMSCETSIRRGTRRAACGEWPSGGASGARACATGPCEVVRVLPLPMPEVCRRARWARRERVANDPRLNTRPAWTVVCHASGSRWTVQDPRTCSSSHISAAAARAAAASVAIGMPSRIRPGSMP